LCVNKLSSPPLDRRAGSENSVVKRRSIVIKADVLQRDAEMPAIQAERLLRHARERGIVRARDLRRLRLPTTVLTRLVRDGRLIRRSRGVYTVPEYEPTEHTDLAAVAKRAPTAVICLLSALRFHGLTTQNPFEVWIMIDRKARRPAIEYPQIRVVRASGAALTESANIHEIEGVEVRVTAPAKTVADCFKYRSTVGTDVAIEALRDCWRQRKATMDEIHRAAKTDRVANVMRPYMESLA
jgi:predicted transcriptional regulator of viral defense system